MKSMAAPALISPPSCFVSTYRNPEAAQRSKADTRLAYGASRQRHGAWSWGCSRNPCLSPVIIRIQEHRSAESYLNRLLYSWRCSSSKKKMHENYTIICRGRSSSLITANRWLMILIA